VVDAVAPLIAMGDIPPLACLWACLRFETPTAVTAVAAVASFSE